MTHLEKHPEALKESAAPSLWGPIFWDELNEIVDKIPCSMCRQHGHEFLQAGRDAIAVTQKGRRPYDPQNLLNVAKNFALAASTCHKHGWCSSDRKPFPHPKGTLPHGFTVCESRHPSVLKKISRCVSDIQARPKSEQPKNAFAVCRASIPCPLHNN